MVLPIFSPTATTKGGRLPSPVHVWGDPSLNRHLHSSSGQSEHVKMSQEWPGGVRGETVGKMGSGCRGQGLGPQLCPLPQPPPPPPPHPHPAPVPSSSTGVAALSTSSFSAALEGASQADLPHGQAQVPPALTPTHSDPRARMRCRPRP
ncbi:hypothetical protein HJG60_009666 [Phyllostomus discolor]|uniref:Uncharacterized protein n=1 Tax=Phyllostomus discolor TaxID=89673 RepID=A0A834B310_9CHIR|nr:hypothetical protein HJG60_009666 [Phyllostomus discolor]